MKSLITLFFSFFLFAGIEVFSQNVTGRILDSETKNPLKGSSIQVVNSFRGVVAGADGVFKINIVPDKKEVLKFSFIGYQPVYKEVCSKYGENIELDIELHVSSIEQQEIIVSGTRIETGRYNVPLSTSVISSVEIENSAEINIMPLMGSSVPGVFVTERGVSGFGVSEGAAGKVTIRGVGSADQSQIMIMIDGQPQVMGIFGHAFPDMYQTSNIEKVEVIRGPGSLLYGSNAMGGVINMITKKQKEDGFSARIAASGGSYGTYRGTATTGFRNKNFSVYAAYNHDQTDGARENSMFKGDNGYLTIGYQINSHFDLTWVSNYSKFYAVDPGPISTSTPDKYADNGAWADIGRVNSMMTLSNNFDNIKGHIKFFFNQGDHELYNSWVSTDRNYGISIFQGLTLFEGNFMGVGIDWNQYGGIGSPVNVPKFVDGTVKWGPSEYNNKWIDVNEKAAFVFVRQNLFNTLTFNGGIRYNHHSLYGGTWIPQLGAIWQASPKNELKALVSKGFRSPNVKELYFFPPANPELLPESMWNYEVGYNRYALNKKLRVSATLFYINGENLIQAVPNPNGSIPPKINQNTGAFENFGAELEASYQIKSNLNVSVTYSYLHTDISRIASPKHMANANVRYLWGKFDFNVSAQAIAGLYTLTDDVSTTDVVEEEIQNYVLLNAKINYRILPSLGLFVSADNLLNTNYSVMYGYPMPGLAIMGGLSFKLN